MIWKKNSPPSSLLPLSPSFLFSFFYSYLLFLSVDAINNARPRPSTFGLSFCGYHWTSAICLRRFGGVGAHTEFASYPLLGRAAVVEGGVGEREKEESGKEEGGLRNYQKKMLRKKRGERRGENLRSLFSSNLRIRLSRSRLFPPITPLSSPPPLPLPLPPFHLLKALSLCRTDNNPHSLLSSKATIPPTLIPHTLPTRFIRPLPLPLFPRLRIVS